MSTGKIEEICSEICDKYCRYPAEIADDELLMLICKKCPLDKLKKGDSE